jgi:hypothetical protein
MSSQGRWNNPAAVWCNLEDLMSPSLTGRRSARILAWLAFAAACGALAAPSTNAAPAARKPAPAVQTIAVPDAGSLAADALTAREKRIPILIFYTREDCPWCEYARRAHLNAFAAAEAAGNPRVLVREIDVEGDRPLTDFAGRTTTHAKFARMRRVRLTPTLDFLDDRGNRLVEPIVGVRLQDYYGTYIDRAIEESLAKLRTDQK